MLISGKETTAPEHKTRVIFHETQSVARSDVKTTSFVLVILIGYSSRMVVCHHDVRHHR